MDLTLLLKVPGHRGRRLRVLVRPPAWVARRCSAADSHLPRGCRAEAWYQPHPRGRVLVGTLALSRVDLELVAHECLHCACSLLWPSGTPQATTVEDEERLATLAGRLTARVWEALS